MMLTMSQVSELILRIRNFAALPGMSKSRLAREAGLSPMTLRNLDRNNFNPEASTLEKLEIRIDQPVSTSSTDHPQ